MTESPLATRHSLFAQLDADVRRYDEDRWLASRFAPAEARARLIAIYALNHEIARTADVVTQPTIGDIRLAWWREALAEIAGGKTPRAHPPLQAIAEDVARSSVWERMIAARGRDLDPAPFDTWRDLEDYVDATAGGVIRMAMAACGVEAEPHEPCVRAAAQAWGCLGLLRAAAHWRARGRALLPREGGALEEMSARVRRAIGEVSALSPNLPAAAFPAVGYVVLALDYLRAHERERESESVPLLLRQFRLIAAAATGRL